jgi:ferritin-like metal-binding protein YciE
MADSDMMGLEDLLKHGLKDMYYAETKIQKSLPKMIKAAQDPDLVAALETHLEETADQIARLEEAFDLMGEKAKAEKCDAMDGILAEGDSLLKDFGGSPAGDAAIIFSCQAVEHYEIARYGSLRAYASLLGMDDVAEIMDGILAQEEATDEKLSDLAESSANPAAAGGMDDDEDEDEEA